MKVRALVIAGPGTNRDHDAEHALELAGAEPRIVLASELVARPMLLDEVGLAVVAGGFSYADSLGAGRMLALDLALGVGDALRRFVADGRPLIGICNGFQVLVKMGLLPDLAGRWEHEVTLVHNESGVFEDRWVRIAFDPASPCAWTRGLDAMDVPVRHGEGRFVARDGSILERLEAGHLAAARYVPRDGGPGPAAYPDNPNGSAGGIAGLSDRTGRVFGLMPHPEAYLFPENHPTWTRADARGRRRAGRPGLRGRGAGLAIFLNGVQAARSR